jgi:hypothetical protein
MKAILLILVITVTLTSCLVHSSARKSSVARRLDELKYDTSKIAIIQLTRKGRSPFDSTYKSALLMQADLEVIDSLFMVCVKEYNNSLDKDHEWGTIDLKRERYRMQLVPAINTKREKEVWVNCFCWTLLRRWKTNLQLTMDGGSCFFSFKINLAGKNYYELKVNGLA